MLKSCRSDPKTKRTKRSFNKYQFSRWTNLYAAEIAVPLDSLRWFQIKSSNSNVFYSLENKFHFYNFLQHKPWVVSEGANNHHKIPI